LLFVEELVGRVAELVVLLRKRELERLTSEIDVVRILGEPAPPEIPALGLPPFPPAALAPPSPADMPAAPPCGASSPSVVLHESVPATPRASALKTNRAMPHLAASGGLLWSVPAFCLRN
jgi:hypothetical protein